ncbi:MAG TPA: hypothetical protein VHE30_29750 [Polyangiaceae bacterium]|nr:hypothetical protein [Polyangiaceae bacterium]
MEAEWELERARVLAELSVHCTTQEHDQYTESDHAVWETALARNEELVARYGGAIHPAHLEGLLALELPRRRVPRIEELNGRLSGTNWRTVCVDGDIPMDAYVRLMSVSVFPVSRALRRPEHIDYAPAPDLVHDVLGHLPMLLSAEHGEFHRRFGAVMSHAVPGVLDGELHAANRHLSTLKSSPESSEIDVLAAEASLRRVRDALQGDASELTHLARMYLWSIGFGLVGKPEERCVVGAALLSSPREFRAAIHESAELVPYSLDVIHHDIEFSDLQKRYFLARDFDHMEDVLTLYESGMHYRGGSVRTSEVRALRRPQGRVRRHA